MKRFILLSLIVFSAQAGLPPTSSKVSGESVYSTTFKTDFGTFKGTRSGTTLTLNSIGAGLGDSLALGGTKAASAILDVQSTTQGVLPPRMTTAQMNAIATPATGLTIYNTDVNSLASWNGTTWTYGFGSLNGDTVYSAKVSSAGVVSGENKTEFIVGNCTGSSPYTCDISSANFTVAPNCIAGVSLASNAIARVESVSTTSVVIRTLSTAPATANSDFTLSCQKSGIDYTLAQNTSAWVQANSNPIATTTEFTAQSDISAGVSRLNSTGWVSNGSIVGALYNFPITGFTVAPNCWANSSQIGAGSVRIVNVTSTSSVLTVEVTGSSGATATTTISFGCQKQGADYTAAHSPFIIGTFAGTPSVPGYLGKVDTFSFTFADGTYASQTACATAPCAYLGQIGTAVSHVNSAGAGIYNAFFNKNYSKVVCQGTAINSGFVPATSEMCIGTCSQVTIYTYADGTARNSRGNMLCQGQY